MRVGKMATINSYPSSRRKPGEDGQAEERPEARTTRGGVECDAKEDEEDPMVMDETEENLPAAPVKAESYVEGTTAMTGTAEGPSEVE